MREAEQGLSCWGSALSELGDREIALDWNIG